MMLKEQMPEKLKLFGDRKTCEILKSLKRADKIIDKIAKEQIIQASEEMTVNDSKSTYVIKGNGFGRGMGMSHPLMDFKCLSPRQVLKIRTKLARNQKVGGVDLNMQYFNYTHLQQRAQEIIQNVTREGGFNSILGTV